MIFLSPHFLGLSDQSYAQKLQEQDDFQSNEESVRITGVLPLTHPIPDTHKTLGGALLSFPEPYPGTQYLLRSIETDPADPSVLFFCTHYSLVSYLESFIETLYPTLQQIHPSIKSTDVWMDPDHHHCTQTLSNLLSHSNTTLSHLLDFSPYGPTDIQAPSRPYSLALAREAEAGANLAEPNLASRAQPSLSHSQPHPLPNA